MEMINYTLRQYLINKIGALSIISVLFLSSCKDEVRELNCLTWYDKIETMENVRKSEGDMIIYLNDNNPYQNNVISPLGFHVASAMLAEATDDEMQKQLISMLGFSDLNECREVFKKFMDFQNEKDYHYPYRTYNSFWYDKNSYVSDEYLDILKNIYNSKTTSVKYSNQSLDIQPINKWLSDKTERNSLLLSGDLNNKYLWVNSTNISFKWNKIYSWDGIRKGDFKNIDGSHSSVDMMYGRLKVQYEDLTDIAKCQLLRFVGSDTYMVLKIYLPNDNVDINDMLALLRANHQFEDYSAYETYPIDLEMPAFEIKSNQSFAEYLQSSIAQGLSKESNIGNNFLPLLNISDLDLIQVLQLKFDKSGCYFDSTTSNTRATGPSHNLISVSINRPFYFEIEHQDFKIASGVINNLSNL